MLFTGRQVHSVLVVIHTEIHDVRQELFIAGNDLKLLLQRLKHRGRQKLPPSAPAAPATRAVGGVRGTHPYLGDLVVVGQEHGQILGLLNGLRIRHFP